MEKHFPDVPPAIPNLAQQFAENPTGLLTTVHCNPWYVEDKAVLLGDSAHSMAPFFGQGINRGFEDCQAMDTLIGRFGPDRGQFLVNFKQSVWKRPGHLGYVSGKFHRDASGELTAPR